MSRHKRSMTLQEYADDKHVPRQVNENVSAHDVVAELLDWAMERYQSEVADRPDVNIYKKTLNTTWQQVLEKLGETKAKLSH